MKETPAVNQNISSIWLYEILFFLSPHNNYKSSLVVDDNIDNFIIGSSAPSSSAQFNQPTN